MFAGPVFEAVVQYAGFFLAVLLFSEEFKRLVAWLRDLTARRPGLKLLVYPLAALLTVAVTALIVNSFITLVTTVLFSYE
jgi:hypothetical protein